MYERNQRKTQRAKIEEKKKIYKTTGCTKTDKIQGDSNILLTDEDLCY